MYWGTSLCHIQGNSGSNSCFAIMLAVGLNGRSPLLWQWIDRQSSTDKRRWYVIDVSSKKIVKTEWIYNEQWFVTSWYSEKLKGAAKYHHLKMTWRVLEVQVMSAYKQVQLQNENLLQVGNRIQDVMIIMQFNEKDETVLSRMVYSEVQVRK